jgi:hypothetical protein
MTTALHQLPAIVLAFITLAALLAIGVLIWQALPRRNARERDIERQIATLRKGADHAVQHRPRVRANGCAATPGHLKAVPKAEKPKACGGGLCRHRADCSDHYCPGRLSASLTGTEARHAHH